MKVEYEKLALSSQVLRRQGDVHCERIASYIPQYALLTPSDTGIVLMPFVAASLAVGATGVVIARTFGQAWELASVQVQDAATTYAAHEQQAYEAFSRAMEQLGITTSAFVDPSQTGTVLGSAGTAAPDDHGDAEPDLITQVREAGDSFRDGVNSLFDDASNRFQSWSGSGAISERSDASSWLVAPNATRSEIENMRWGAGPILGGVDWIIDQLTGVSFLEDVIMKPFAGDWKGIEEVQQAWEHIGEAMRAMSDNGAGLAETGIFWEGEAGTAYQGGMLALSGAAFGLGAVADSVAGVVGNLLLASNAMAATIGFALNKLSEKLLRMAAEAAIPVAGWLVAAAEGALAVHLIFSTMRLVYNIINMIYDLIESVIEAKASLVENLLRLEDLVQVLAQRGRTYA